MSGLEGVEFAGPPMLFCQIGVTRVHDSYLGVVLRSMQ